MNRLLTEDELNNVIKIGLSKLFPGRFLTWRLGVYYPDGQVYKTAMMGDVPDLLITIQLTDNRNTTEE